jgi:ATP-dependent helicase/nuclease subunit A
MRAGSIYQLPPAAQGTRDTPSDASSADEETAVWRDSLTTPRETAEETRKTLECRQAARWIAGQLHSAGLPPQDVMVLARKRERLGLMQAELAALGIPAQQVRRTS